MVSVKFATWISWCSCDEKLVVFFCAFLPNDDICMWTGCECELISLPQCYFLTVIFQLWESSHIVTCATLPLSVAALFFHSFFFYYHWSMHVLAGVLIVLFIPSILQNIHYASLRISVKEVSRWNSYPKHLRSTRCVSLCIVPTFFKWCYRSRKNIIFSFFLSWPICTQHVTEKQMTCEIISLHHFDPITLLILSKIIHLQAERCERNMH